MINLLKVKKDSGRGLIGLVNGRQIEIRIGLDADGLIIGKLHVVVLVVSDDNDDSNGKTQRFLIRSSERSIGQGKTTF